MQRFRPSLHLLSPILVVFFLLFTSQTAFTQTNPDAEEVKKAALGYIEGFYEGDTQKLVDSLKPSLHKFGFWKKEGSASYVNAGTMTFDEAVEYAKNVKIKEEFAKPDAPKGVEVLDLTQKIAAAKITAWWGVDYVLLSKSGAKWMIEQIIWEGPARESAATDLERAAVQSAALNYVEGFYEGDASKLREIIKPSLYKLGYGVIQEDGKYRDGSRMTFEQAIAYADRVKESGKFPSPDAPKQAQVIDVMNQIAIARVDAWWGVDYILLSKNDGKWMIEQVLWAGVL